MNGNKRYSITKYITGGCWIISGILGHFRSIVTDIIRIAFLVLLVGILIYQTGIKLDKPKQETSSGMKAKDLVTTVICCASCTVAVLIFVISLLLDAKDWEWLFCIMRIFSITLGIGDIRTGLSLYKSRSQKADRSDKMY